MKAGPGAAPKFCASPLIDIPSVLASLCGACWAMQVEIMAKKMLIDATHAEETRVVVVNGNKVEEFDFESQNKRQIAGNIYLAKVMRVEPSLQAAFVDYGGNRHGFLAFSEVHPDYYQIPVADREALLAEEKAYAVSMAAELELEDQKPKRNRRSRSKSSTQRDLDPVETRDIAIIDGMETINLDENDEQDSDGVAQVVRNETVEQSTLHVDDAITTVLTEADFSTEVADLEQNIIPQIVDTDEDDTEYDDGIKSVAQEDDSDDVHPVRKPRPRRYKIQEVVKVRQVMLIQVVKEERGNKGAALTTYLSLAGRYCVLMPNTARGGGISRKITNVVDRKKLKAIATTIVVPDGAGLIVRTAGAKRTKTEIKRDYEYLQRMWEQIRAFTLKSSAPSAIYEEGDLIKRSIRDLYNSDIDEILVEGAEGYRNAKDTMKMIMPSHTKNVKQYVDTMPLFARFQVESFMDGMFNPTVQLKSGGYLVIGITEALVAIDVNSGRATKEGSIEQTALNTNLEAAEEVARQVRLRDLAGLIVIDFIDMDERRNNTAVEKRMNDKLQTDRARIQVGRISGFGLMEMSRQRLRPGMLEASTQPCSHCHGTGLIRSQDSLGLTILRELEEEGARARSKEVLIKAPISIANFLINEKREHISQIEQRYGMAVRVEADPFLISPDYVIDQFKTTTRVVPAASASETVSSVDISLMEEIDGHLQDDEQQDEALEVSTEEEAPKKRRRRRRRRRGGNDSEGADSSNEGESIQSNSEDIPVIETDETAAVVSDEEKPKRRRRTRGGSKVKLSEADKNSVSETVESVAVVEPETLVAIVEGETINEATVEKHKRVRTPRNTKAQKEAKESASIAAEPVADVPVNDDNIAAVEALDAKLKAKRIRKSTVKKSAVSDVETTQVLDDAKAVPSVEVYVEETPDPETLKASAPKKRGWWSRG